MSRIDIDLLRYGSRGAVYRVNYDSRMLIAESRVPACEAARGAAGREFSGTRPYANDRRVLDPATQPRRLATGRSVTTTRNRA